MRKDEFLQLQKILAWVVVGWIPAASYPRKLSPENAAGKSNAARTSILGYRL